jgi:hypothetical protein
MGLRQRLDDLGFVGERRAVAVLLLAFYAVLYFLVALSNPEGLGPAFGGLCACYALAIFALVAGWFWARWFTNGLAWSGMMMGALALIMGGWNVVFGIYAGSHGAMFLCLGGRRMAEVFDLQAAWRERFGLDEHGVVRVRRAVTRAAAALPSLVLWALAPRHDTAALALAIAGALGLVGLIRLRTVGVLLCGVGAVGAAVCAACAPSWASFGLVHGLRVPAPGCFALLAAAALSLAFVPFARPLVRYLRGR